MDFMDLFSDEDDEIVQFIERPIAARRYFERSHLFESLPEDKFVRRFRLRKDTVLMLLREIQPYLQNSQRYTTATAMNQLLCTLRFYATGSQIITCGDVISVLESTACRIIHRVTHAIALLYQRYIKFPTTTEEKQQVASEFFKKAKFPRVTGAIDCTHVRILSPGGDLAEIYRNRKGWFSINTQCVAGPNLMFYDVVSRWHGSAHDANIWDNCALKRDFLQGNNENKYLLGDSGYAQCSYMMTPLAEGRVVTRGEVLYQESQIKTRNVIERAFGVWKRRFPILSRGINLHLHRVPGIIIATAVLHNLAITQNEVVPPEDNELPHLADLAMPVPDHPQRGGRDLERRMLIETYFALL